MDADKTPQKNVYKAFCVQSNGSKKILLYIRYMSRKAKAYLNMLIHGV